MAAPLHHALRQSFATFAAVASMAAVAVLGATASTSAHAQGRDVQRWEPSRPIRLLVPYGPGGSSDVIARAVAAEMSKGLGQAIVVENKGGGQGTIATTEAARARPDGYTLLLGHVGTLAVNPAMMPKLAYDPRRSFAPVTLLARVPMIFAVGQTVPATTLSEFVTLAKAKPGTLNYGSAGNGSAGHLAFEMLKSVAAIDVRHVPYKGTGAQINDLLAGNIDAASAGTPGLLEHARSGRVRILAVGSAHRLAVLPQVPTVAEQGYPGFESSQWFGILAPAGTPEAVIARLNDEAIKAMRSPSVQQRLQHDSSEAVGQGPAQFAAFIRSEQTRWARVVHDAGLAGSQ
ncbi:tripartite-type tricarboxylate transporter receptor subunit TctC [Cupriavidus gilardii J11]|uniref:Tripartite-type tricarboxylate transporter receptor subunit TctC n=1 Tax=Cupriavidus gilardii J11 TaxID=936133 RepID=A0A562BTP5_9BURK|nr:tripartite tricarboxylate transporter substrate binding protein [Cupriavidus gilardii]TWG88645.1 tripartite-type tricarboxylate transporter receptor subunit TctC [Cupriavidus gilardii J11]